MTVMQMRVYTSTEVTAFRCKVSHKYVRWNLAKETRAAENSATTWLFSQVWNKNVSSETYVQDSLEIKFLSHDIMHRMANGQCSIKKIGD